jgi:hypothetical protein
MSLRDGTVVTGTAQSIANGLAPAADPEVRARVTLMIERSELGHLGLHGSSGFSVGPRSMVTVSQNLAVGINPAVRDPENAVTMPV